ncbi:MAG: two-component system sensor histidine kinase PhoQ [Enterobacteriaceae bacterium]|jgi:two-component system sensor histidine kinase PhoQ|nr:two-component system sensor histidine kinase PhoQ [Enterobacteriaceae bacterium]
MLDSLRKIFSLRTRFLIATTSIILAMALSYGVIAMVGYLVGFNKTMYSTLRNESKLFYNSIRLCKDKTTVCFPDKFSIIHDSLILVYNNKSQIIWRQENKPSIEKLIQPNWLKKEGLYEYEDYLEMDNLTFSAISNNNKQENNNYDNKEVVKKKLSRYSVAVTIYPKDNYLPELTIVVVDLIPQDIQPSDKIWIWFIYALIINLILVIPFIWFAAEWSLNPIKSLISQMNSIEKGERERLDDNSPYELKGLIQNLNALLNIEQQRYTKYRTTLSDLAHSLKTPLAVLQFTMRSFRLDKQVTLQHAEAIILEQIDRISQQIGYYLHRANLYDNNNLVMKKISSVPILLDNLIHALAKVYQHKGVNITLDISPEMTWFGERIGFMEVLGSILDNAYKYCVQFIKVTALTGEDCITIIVDDDGPGIPPDKRDIVFKRGSRENTLRPGQGLGLSIAVDIVTQQYDGSISIDDSSLGGARVSVTFKNQHAMNHSHQ